MAECSICNERWTAAGAPHEPKIFPCGHSCCSTCLSGLIQRSATPGVFDCYMCRQRISVESVKTNFALLDLLQASQQASPMQHTQSPQAPPPQQDMQAPSQGSVRDIGPASHQALLASAIPEPSAPPAAPWEVGAQIAYNGGAPSRAVGRRGAPYQTTAPVSLSPPPDLGCAPTGCGDVSAWMEQRKQVLKDWGCRREAFLHRPPRCLMDQMVSGSGFFPPRLLDDHWFTAEELTMVRQLQSLLSDTGNASFLSKDMMTFRLQDVDVRIILDNSGSMQLNMLGGNVDQYGRAWGIDQKNFEDLGLLNRTLESELPSRGRVLQPAPPGISPFHRRWYFARDALKKWMQVFQVLDMVPTVYKLNPLNRGARCRTVADVDRIFLEAPGGRTPMTEVLQTALYDFSQVRQTQPDKTMLTLIITDGEANDMQSFTRTLDEIQNGIHGDVQVCLMGLSLVKEDVEWFENEECDDTRIRTVEAFEVENRQIQLKEVVRIEGAYNFAMHTYRTLLTNFFPADYDYEAHIQNLRHRLYITYHGRDRWWGLNSCIYKYLCSNLVCGTCFLVTCCHCCGWCQGNECGKYECHDCLQGCCGEE